MPYVSGAFDGSDSDSDDGVITYTPPASDKHLSPAHQRDGDVRSGTLLEIVEEISLCMMSMEVIDREDPDYDQITQRLEALHAEYRKVLDSSHVSEEAMRIRRDTQTLLKQPLPINKKAKKWNTVKMAPGAAPQTRDKPNNKPDIKALPTRTNVPRTFVGGMEQYMDPDETARPKVKSAGNIPLAESAQNGSDTVFMKPGLSRAPKWADQISPELKTYDQFMGIPYGQDVPTPDLKAMPMLEQLENVAKSPKTHSCNDSWNPCGECEAQTTSIAREHLSEDEGRIGWDISPDIPKSTGQKAAVESATKMIDTKKPDSTHFSMSPDATMLDQFAEVTDYFFTRDEAFGILRMCGANLDVAISMFRNGGGAPHLKKMLNTWLSPTENDDAIDKDELRGQDKVSPGCMWSFEDCEPPVTFDPKEDYFRCCFCGYCFNVKHGDACMDCGEKSGLYPHHTPAKTTSEHGSDIPENLVTGWGMPNTKIGEGMMWGDLPEDKVIEPATNTGFDVKQALAILGLDAYNSVDLRTLREHFTEVLNTRGHTRQLIAQISSAFDSVVNHHDANDCWKLSPIPWSKQMDIELMTLKEDARITWNAVAQELGMSSEECKERFRAIKPRDWNPASASKYTEWGTSARGPKSDCGDAWCCPDEISTGDPWSRSVPQNAPSVSVGDCWKTPFQNGDGGLPWTIDPEQSSQKAVKTAGARAAVLEPNEDAWCATGEPVKQDTERNNYSRFATSSWDTAAPEDTPLSTPSVVHDGKLPQPKAQTPTAYTVTFWATIEHGDQSIHVPIDSENIFGPEKAIVEGDTSMKKVWKWVQEKGLGGKISLQDAFDLAKDMHCKDEADESEADEQDFLKPTLPVVMSRCSSPGYIERRANSVDSRCRGRDEHAGWCSCT